VITVIYIPGFDNCDLEFIVNQASTLQICFMHHLIRYAITCFLLHLLWCVFNNNNNKNMMLAYSHALSFALSSTLATYNHRL